MGSNHLFSSSLFDKLFQHNLVSSDGFVKANDAELINFREFLVQEGREKTAASHKKRKSMVDEVLKLLREDELSPQQTKKMILLLHKLNMRVTEDGTLEALEPKVHKKNLGPSEPNSSTWERRLKSEEERRRVLKRDLKELDVWLRDISKPTSKIRTSTKRLPERTQDNESRFSETEKRPDLDMEAKNLKKGLDPKPGIGETGPKRSERTTPNKDGDITGASDDTFVTAVSDMSSVGDPYGNNSENYFSADTSEGTEDSETEKFDPEQDGAHKKRIDSEFDHHISLDCILSNEERERRSSSRVSVVKKDTKTRDPVESNSSTRGPITFVYEVKRVPMFDLLEEERKSLKDVISFFPTLQEKVYGEEVVFEFEDPNDSELEDQNDSELEDQNDSELEDQNDSELEDQNDSEMEDRNDSELKGENDPELGKEGTENQTFEKKEGAKDLEINQTVSSLDAILGNEERKRSSLKGRSKVFSN